MDNIAILTENQNEILEIKNTVIAMKVSFGGSISKLNMVRKRISELVNV